MLGYFQMFQQSDSCRLLIPLFSDYASVDQQKGILNDKNFIFLFKGSSKDIANMKSFP